MTNKEYQKMELSRFMNQKTAFFDTVKEFSESLENMDIPEQIEWIENGNYGAGACFALQQTLNSLNNRTNNTARIGQTVLHAFYGAPFDGRKWHKLSEAARNSLTIAVKKWLASPHDFAQILEVD